MMVNSRNSLDISMICRRRFQTGEAAPAAQSDAELVAEITKKVMAQLGMK